MKNVPEKYKQGQDWADATWITAIEVEERYGVSRQQQRNLYMKGAAPDALYLGATLLYWRSSAEPYFREYDKRQKERIDSSEKRKEKRRPGRPKKVKGEYTYTLWGQEYKDTRPPAEVEREWKIKVASYYPHVMQDVENHKPLQEAMTCPDQYPDYRDHVRPLFAEIGKLFRNLEVGKES